MRFAIALVAMSLGWAMTAHAIDPLVGIPDTVKVIHKALIDTQQCQDEVMEASQVFKLNGSNSLVIVSCIVGAYQGSSRVYVIGSGAFVTQVAVLAYDGTNHAVIGSVEIGDATFDPQESVLYSHAKGRGMGDCGQNSVTKVLIDKYGGVSLKTIEVRSKDDCDGQYGEWPVVYTQK